MSDKPIPERCDDERVMRIWRECGLPEYFIGNGGTNDKLVEFAERVAEAALSEAQAEIENLEAMGNLKGCVREIQSATIESLQQQLSEALRKLKLEESEHMLACQVAEQLQQQLVEAQQERDDWRQVAESKHQDILERADRNEKLSTQVTQQAATLSEARARIKWLEAHGNHFRNPDTGQIECSCCETNGQLVDELRNEITMYRRYGGIE